MLPIAAKIAKRIVALLGEITLAPTAVSHGVAASFAPKFHAIKKDKAHPIINKMELSSTHNTRLTEYGYASYNICDVLGAVR